MKRPPFETRTFRLVGADQRARLIALVENLPLDAAKPLEVVIREEKKKRTPDQNALYWSGPLREIAEQAWVRGRQYSADVWHEHLKREFLPDPDRADCDYSHIKDGYVKWSAMPNGSRVLIGSTTGLTVRGMAAYLEQVYAYGASLGVQLVVGDVRVARDGRRRHVSVSCAEEGEDVKLKFYNWQWVRVIGADWKFRYCGYGHPWWPEYLLESAE